MRGHDTQQAGMFSYLSPEERVPVTHPLRPIRQYVDTALTALSPQLAKLYAHTGRPSIAPEKLLRALLLQVLYSVRSERLLMEQLDYNLLFRWFVGLSMDDAGVGRDGLHQEPGPLAGGRDRPGVLRAGAGASRGPASVVRRALHGRRDADRGLGGPEELQAARTSRARPPTDDPGNPTVDFRGERRTNATHASTTDPEARLYRKASGQEAKLCFLGHVLMENRHGLVVDACVTPATGTAEREAALAMVGKRSARHADHAGGDKAYDTHEFVAGSAGAAGHARTSPSTRRTVRSAIDGRTTRHPGYAVSQQKRKRVEEIFGWLKTVGLLRKVKRHGVRRVGWLFTFAAAVYNLVRIRNLVEAAP